MQHFHVVREAIGGVTCGAIFRIDSHGSTEPLRIMSRPVVAAFCLKELIPASGSSRLSAGEQTDDRFFAHWLERLRRFQRLVEDFHVVDARYYG